tara:strand:- start:202 stop:885 length:684 start_codon:yes stop_codon:yes gene_type:complete
MQLENYLWASKGFFTPEEVKEIHLHASMIPIEEGSTGFVPTDPDSPEAHQPPAPSEEIRSSKIKWFNPNIGFGLPEPIVLRIWDAFMEANVVSNWNHKLEFLENMQYTIYEHTPSKSRSDFYTWHTDHGGKTNPDGMHRKLSMSIQLSEPDEYDGGLFQWLEPNRQFDRIKKGEPFSYDEAIRTVPESIKTSGSVIVFPSFVHHQVTPVVQGTRISMVVWANGYPYV